MTIRDKIKQQLKEWRIFARHVIGLLDPSRPVASALLHEVDLNPEVHRWSEEHRATIAKIAEDELIDLNARFEAVRGKSQVFLVMNLALVSVLAASEPAIWDGSWYFYVPWGIALFLIVLGALGHAATYAVTAELGWIDAVVSTKLDEDVFEKQLLLEQLNSVKTSVNALGTRRSVSDNSVRLTVWGGLLYLAVWLSMNI